MDALPAVRHKVSALRCPTQHRELLEKHQTPRKAFLPSVLPSWLPPWKREGQLIFQEELDTWSFPNLLKKCCSWDCFHLPGLKWGVIYCGIKAFWSLSDLWGDYLHFYKRWCFLLGEWHGSWQAPARRGSAESLTEAVPPYRARKKPHRPLPLLMPSSWSRCATASHRKEFLKSKQNKFLYQSSASSASWTPNTSAQCQKSSPNLSIHLLEQYNNL